MDIQKIFPFYEIAPVINREIHDRFDLTHPRYMKTGNIPQIVLSEEVINILWTYFGSTRIELIHIVPNDIYFYAGSDEILRVLMNYSYIKNKYVPVIVTNIDYSVIANDLSIYKREIKRKRSNGYEVRNCYSVRFIQDALKGDKSELKKGGKLLEEEEALPELDFNEPIPCKTIRFIDEIESYLRSTDVTEQIPILIGLSGIAKSALVKSITEKLDKDEDYLRTNPYGMRLVDFRVSFMSALDINGMFSKSGDNIKLSPTIEFFSCTDEFLTFARAFVKLLDKKLKDEEMYSDEERLNLLQVQDRFKYFSKTPVFFFDEITRSSSDIQGALSIILNQRLYQQYHLNEARIIAATNMPYIEKEFKSEKEKLNFENKLSNIFLRTNIKDIAIVDKLVRLKISPEQVLPSWLNWARSSGIHPAVISFIEKYPELAYDLTPIAESDNESLQVKKIIPAYPSYRTWANVSDYLNYLESEHIKEINPLMVSGLIGIKCSEKFIKFLKSKFKFSIKQEDISADKIMTLVDDSMAANLPLMLVGVPGIGKTSRIRDYCKSQGFDPFVISLATMDRTELMGAATLRNFEEYLSGMDLNQLIGLDEINSLKDSIPDFPDTLTVRSPRFDLRQRIKATIDSGRTLVLIFDEANRCLDSITQSIIFKAISDNEIFGIKFPKSRVRIVVLGNLSGGRTSGAKAFDSALYARCVVYVQSEYSVEDSKNLINYMKANKFSPILTNFITKKLPNPEEHVLDWLKSIEEASLLNNVPTARTLKTLSDILNRKPLPDGDQLFGMVLNPLPNINLSFKKTYNDLKELAFQIFERIDNWAAIGCYDFYKKGNLTYTLSNDGSSTDAITVFKTTIMKSIESVKSMSDKRIKEAVNWIERLLNIDDKVKAYRKKIFSDLAGDNFADMFSDYYNEVSGTDSLSFDLMSIRNPNNIKKFVDFEMPFHYSNGIYHWSDILISAVDTFGSDYSDLNYLKLILSCIEFDLSASGDAVENARFELKEALNNSAVEELISRLELFEPEDYKLLIQKLKYSNDEYSQVSGQGFIGEALF